MVIQVSIFNDEDYEIDAINDLATHAADGQGEKPKLGVLIKIREADARRNVKPGFDIYYLPAGAYWTDALPGTNGAKKDVYNHGEDDVMVTITEEDLGGITLGFRKSARRFFQGGGRGDFKLSMAELYKRCGLV